VSKQSRGMSNGDAANNERAPFDQLMDIVALPDPQGRKLN
jgi:hypothetical protein